MAELSTDSLERAPGHVKRYQRQKLWAEAGSAIAALVALILLATVVGPVVGEHLRREFGGEMWSKLIAVAAMIAVTLELATLPIDFWSSYIVEHQHGLSTQTLFGWVVRRIKGYAVGGVLGIALICGLYALLWQTGDWWWLWATAGWLAVTLVLGRLLPIVILPLYYRFNRLDDETLLTRLRALCEGTGLNVEGVYKLHMSDETRKANAALAGLGKTRRVLLGDTLLDTFTPDEIEVVFAHEVGHHVHQHLVKMIVYRVAVSLAGFWLVDRILRAAAPSLGYQGLTDPAALPLVLLVITVFGLILSPLGNALSRYFEVQCDTYALQRTHRPDAFRSAFAKLARMNKSDPDPHPVVVWLFYDHPPIRERLALADRVL
ncbi:MAG: M48 family metallopeptidase [Planctomycetota bacterium]